MKSKLIFSAISAALAIASAPAQAGAIANSYLKVSDFVLSFGDGQLGGGTAIDPFTNFSFLSGDNSGDVSASLSGASPSTDTANPAFNLSNPFDGQFSLSKSQGAGYVTGTQLTGPNAVGMFAGSTASLSGNSLVPGNPVTSIVENQVSLTGSSVGTAQSNTGVNAEATFVLAQSARLQLAFNAQSYLRSFVSAEGQAGSNASAKHGWIFTLVDSISGTEIARWNPNGTVGTGDFSGGTEYADAFKITDSRSASNGNRDFIVDNTAGGAFEFETNLLQAGTYQLSIRQDSQADAKFVPEPGTLALLGLGLLGAGTLRRRAKSGEVI